MFLVKQIETENNPQVFVWNTDAKNITAKNAQDIFNEALINYAHFTNKYWRRHIFHFLQENSVPKLKYIQKKLRELYPLGKQWQEASDVSSKIKITHKINSLADEFDECLWDVNLVPDCMIENSWGWDALKILHEIDCSVQENVFNNRTFFFLNNAIASYLRQGHATPKHLDKFKLYINSLINVINELANHSVHIKLRKKQLQNIYNKVILEENLESTNIKKIVISTTNPNLSFKQYLTIYTYWRSIDWIRVI